MAYLVDCSEADIEEADADISQHTWLAFTPIIIGANVYFIGGCLFTWMMAIIDEIWRQGIPAVSVASGLIGLALAAVIGYVLASVASALSLAVVTSINKSLRNVIRPRTAAFLSGGLAAYLLTLPVLLSVAESGLDQAMLAFLIGPAAMMVLIHVAIAWSFRRADFLAAADRLLGQPIDRKTLTTAVTKKTGFRLKPARPSTLRMPNLSDVHPLDCSDDEGDATAVSARASTQQRDQQVTDQERVPAAIEAPNVSPPPPDVDRSMSSFQTGQWTIRSVLILMVWIAIPLAIVAACGSSYYALAGMLIVGFVVCQFVAFVLAKLITLPMNYFIARQTVRYIQ